MVHYPTVKLNTVVLSGSLNGIITYKKNAGFARTGNWKTIRYRNVPRFFAAWLWAFREVGMFVPIKYTTGRIGMDDVIS
jgi:hypothetical protein